MAGLTQAGFAEALCVHVNSVSRWECGSREPSLEMAKRIVETLGANLSDVFGSDGLNPPTTRKVARSSARESGMAAVA
ncbi:helix-turn-helix transcriptional regulator [Cloacibacillus evryensis]|uniref:helix-turn-helix transcriptional regulator n=1 Tax=Cloacibacillus evryensis TaxID=508460 RepID=UPI0034E5F5E5